MHKKQELTDIIKCCELRFNRGTISDWKHSDFGELSRKILLDTDTAISPNTLKRIFGKISVPGDYLPQQATIEALKKYGRYVPQETSIEQKANSGNNEPSIDTQKSKVKPYRWIIISAIIIAFAACVFIALKTLSSDKSLSGSIILTNTEGLLPATVLFKLQLPETNDSLFVNFGDKTALAPVTAGQNKIAHNYLFPGVFKVSLQTRKNTIAKTIVCVHSDKWIALGFRLETDLPERYYEFPALKTGDDSIFQISNSQLDKMGLDTNGLYYTRLCNFTPINYTSEDFIFEATFKNSMHEKGVYCKGTQFQVSGMNGFIRFKLASPGCSYRVINVVSEQTFNGSKDDLSQFILNLEKWNTLKLINQNKQLSLFVNGKLLYEGTYKKSIGQIQGLFLEFEGNGFVKNCDLKSVHGKTLYHF